MSFCFGRFQKADYPAYAAWFGDSELNRRLGPMDEDWLEAVLSQKPQDGATWAVFRGGELVAVAETAFSPQDPWLAAITALAVRPDLRAHRVGTAVLKELLQRCYGEGRLESMTYVHADNRAARRCFTRDGFVLESLEPSEHGYLLFRHRLSA